MRPLFSACLVSILLTLGVSPSSSAVTVNPRGVNVRLGGPSTVFLTFQDLQNQRAIEALWCGEINVDQSCVESTILGRLPLRSDLSRTNGTTFTDIMTIPTSVARRAYQDALKGSTAQFFYVRRFVSTTGGADEFVAVTCRLTSGGAGVPLALLDVRLKFDQDSANSPIFTVSQGNLLPRFGAEVLYNGTGQLKGRWEVVLPGDVQPTSMDLLTEATLPLEQRGTQRRYTQIGRIDQFLAPTGKVFIPGPDPAQLPQGSSGLHLILLRIEASDNRVRNSDTGSGIVETGGVAGFPLPVLRYYVSESVDALPNAQSKGLQLLSPTSSTPLPKGQPVNFSWLGTSNAVLYKLVVSSESGEIFSALLDPSLSSYTSPPLLENYLGKPLRWVVQALDPQGKVVTQSDPQEFQIQP